MAAASRQVDRVADRVARAAVADPLQADAADLSAEAVRLLAAQRAFQTAVKLARTADEMQKKALGLLA